MNRKVYIKDNLCYIPLQDGREAITNAEYYDKIKDYISWFYINTYVGFRLHGQRTYLHRFLFPEFKKCTFINKNKLDCRKENITEFNRSCYIKDNLCYIPLQDKTTAITNAEYINLVSKYNWTKTTGGYAVTSINNKLIFLHIYLFSEIKLHRFINENTTDCRKENIIEIDRHCFIKDNICYIPLANTDKLAMCDADRFDEVNKYNWAISDGRVSTNINDKQCRLHRFLYPQWKMIDHINHDTSDNRSCNLREVTPKQNMMNTRVRKNSKSGYKGVSFSKDKNKYRVQVINKFVGYFKTSEEAAEAYNKKALELFGEYACLNVIKNKRTVL
jgi:hypothetical protein